MDSTHGVVRPERQMSWSSYSKSVVDGESVRVVTFLRAAIALLLALSLTYGCTRESEDIAKLREENRALKEKVAALEGQKPAAPSKPDMEEEVLDFARKLKASPNDFVGQQIKLHCRFGGFESKFLNDTNGPKFLSTYYVGFIAQSGREIAEPLFDHLFMSKKQAKEQSVYRLGINDLITIYGIVNSAYHKEPWIEVYVVKKGWE
jgi:hypothetical protein